jgi:hypothetical protein
MGAASSPARAIRDLARALAWVHSFAPKCRAEIFRARPSGYTGRHCPVSTRGLDHRRKRHPPGRLQGDGISPNPILVSTACQAFEKNLFNNSCESSSGAINPPSAHSPSLSCAQITMSGPFPAWAAIEKLSVYFFRGLDGNIDPIFGFEFLCGRRESIASVGIHPDQKLAIGPGEEVHRDQTESENNRDLLFHFGARRLRSLGTGYNDHQGDRSKFRKGLKNG